MFKSRTFHSFSATFFLTNVQIYIKIWIKKIKHLKAWNVYNYFYTDLNKLKLHVTFVCTYTLHFHFVLHSFFMLKKFNIDCLKKQIYIFTTWCWCNTPGISLPVSLAPTHSLSKHCCIPLFGYVVHMNLRIMYLLLHYFNSNFVEHSLNKTDRTLKKRFHLQHVDTLLQFWTF